MNKLPFSDLKVVELGTVLAIPSVGVFFAELGAEVLKIEPPQGDMTRTWKLPGEKREPSAYYSTVNHGKKILFRNLRNPEHLREIKKYISKADIFLTNLRTKKLKELKLDYEHIRREPLIYGQITGYGKDDNTPGFDAVIQAESGFMFLNRRSQADAPMKMPVALMDLLAAHHLKEGVLMALYHREKTGQGGFVHVSLLKSALSSLANQASAWLYAKLTPEPLGSEHPSIVPYGSVFQTQDKLFLQLAVGTDKQFQMLCEVLGIPEISRNPDFATNPQRVKHREQTNKIIAEAVRKFPREKLFKALRERGVPCAQVKNIQEAFSSQAGKELLINGGQNFLQTAFETNFFTFKREYPREEESK